MKQTLRLILALVLVSCATPKSRYELESVDVDSTNANTLQINENESSTYGPKIEVDKNQSEGKGREPLVALVNYSTLYHSLAFVGELKKYEKEKIRISLVAANGFSALLAALYAKERSVSFVEWKLFSLTKKLKPLKIYSVEWTNVLSDFIEEEFKELNTNQLSIQLIVPYLQNGEIKYDQKVSVVKALLETLNIKSEKSPFRSPQNIDNQLRKDFAMDFVVNSSYLPVTPTITKLNSFQYGLFTSYLGKLMATPAQFGLQKAPVKIEIDEVPVTSEVENLYAPLIDERTQKLLEDIKIWKEDSSKL